MDQTDPHTVMLVHRILKTVWLQYRCFARITKNCSLVPSLNSTSCCSVTLFCPYPMTQLIFLYKYFTHWPGTNICVFYRSRGIFSSHSVFSNVTKYGWQQ